MRLKHIKLIGFKSFVDQTILSLNAQLVGVVGPNGCGKSNIIDAVKWVLGESSAKDLRGSSMVDVIFNGSHARKPIGLASVELLFDNLEDKLIKEYANFNEIAIRREIDRDRQSDYYLNDKQCRKRDITDLFAGTGVLENGYAIIGQGTISKIIESKPDELRSFIEEAAEISIYKKRRHETELRIGHTEENLNRLQDLSLEQGRLLGKLETQAIAAEKYINYQKEKKTFETKILYIKHYNFNKELNCYNKEIAALSQQLNHYLTEKSEINLQIEEQKNYFNEKFSSYTIAKDNYYQLDNQIVKLEQSLEYKKQQHNKLQVDLKLINSELENLQEQHNKDQLKQQDIVADLTIVEKKYSELLIKKEAIEKVYTKNQLAMQNLQKSFNNTQLSVQNSNHTAEKNKFSIEQLENLGKELSCRITKLDQEKKSYELEQLQAEIIILEDRLKLQESFLQNKNQELEGVNHDAKLHKENLKKLVNDKSFLQSEIHKLQGQIGSLEILQQNFLDLGSKKLDWLNTNNVASTDSLFNKLIVADGWEVAVGAVLNKYLDGFFLDDINNCAASILQSKLDFRLVLLENQVFMVDDNRSIVHHNFISLISKITNDFTLVALFNNVYLAEDLRFAIENKKQLAANEFFVTKKGDMVGPNWLIIDEIDNRQQALYRNKMLKELAINLENSTIKLTELNHLIDIDETALNEIESKEIVIINKTKEQASIIRSIASDLSAKQSKLDSIKARTEKINTEIKEYQDKLVEIDHKINSFRLNLTKAIEETAGFFEQEQKINTEKTLLQQSIASLKEELNSINKDVHIIALEKQQLITKNHALTEAKQRLSEQIKNLTSKQFELQNSVQLNIDFKSLELEIDLLLNDKITQQQMLKAAKLAFKTTEENLNNLEVHNNKLIEIIESIKTKIENYKLEAKALAIRLEDLNILAKENDINLLSFETIQPTAVEDLSADMGLWQEKLDLIIKKITKLGAVNLTSIEDFKTEQQRKLELDSQIDDLTSAIATLRDAILKIDLQTKQKFKDTFEKINHNFSELFPKLFGGGKAHLELITNDLLSGGVSVIAQPPGKKNSSIYLLSGGEKTLTAIAFIFAIFQLNPAPFCILDEVDAPLDEANVIRFGELLIDMSRQVQFIFITHNKMTMKIASQLIGVTMKEPGVSRLVSVNIDEALAMID